jgi:uncharacterized membrane protein YfcA
VIVLLTLVLGVFIGGVMGALGGGGAVLSVPALVYVLGQSGQDATTSSLVIVGLAAAFAAAGHARLGTVRWEIGIPFGAVGIAAAFAGTALNRRLAESTLLFGFSLLMIVCASAMLARARRESVYGPLEPPTGGGPGASDRTPVGSASTAVAVRQRVAVRVLVIGAAVGLLTGLFGVGGGFIIVPALTLGLGLAMPQAIGTALLVIAVNSAGSLVARAVWNAHMDWSVIVPFTLAAIVGTVVGRRLAGGLPAPILTRAFAGLLIVVALYTGTENVLRLS